MAVKGTEWSIRDASGKVLCHSAGMSRGNANSARKRAWREAVEAMYVEAGLLRDGLWQDVVTGAWLPMADESTASDDYAVVERGHVIADNNGGALCACNTVAENKGSNRARGDRSDHDPRHWRGTDPRSAWALVWLRTARPGKRDAFLATLTDAERADLLAAL